MQVKNWMRVTAFVVAAQMINVQINAAMGNQAMAAMNPEYQSMMSRFEAKVDQFLGDMSEQAQLNFAYKIYRVSVKTRNHIAKMSDKKFEKRLARANAKIEDQDQVAPTLEETQLAQEVSGIDELTNLQNAFDGGENVGATPVVTNKSEFIAKIDATLTAFGSVVNANGKMSIVSKAAFQKKALELSKQEGRTPASSKFLKVLGNLILILLAVSLLALCLVFVLGIIFAAATFLVYALAIVIAGGVVIVVSGKPAHR